MGLPLNSLILKLSMKMLSRILCKTDMPPASSRLLWVHQTMVHLFSQDLSSPC